MRRLLLLVLLLLACAAGVAAAVADDERVRVRLSGPRTATAGSVWAAALTVSPASAGRPRVVARGPTGTRPARIAALGRGRWRATLTFPRAGRWTLSARVGSRSHALGAVTVRVGRRPVHLVQPGGLAVAADGSLVVAVQGENRVLRIDPATGAVRVLAQAPRPWGIAIAPDGALVFSSGSEIVRRAPDGGTTMLARFPVDAGPVAFAPNGDLFVGVSDHRVYRIRGGTVEPYAGDGDDMSSPHGFAFPADGSLLVSDTGFDRILRVDGATKAVTTFADGVRVPNGIALAPDGGLWVTESQARRVTRIAPSGERQSVGPFEVPTQVAVAPSGALYVVEWGKGHIRRVDPDGTITTVTRRVG